MLPHFKLTPNDEERIREECKLKGLISSWDGLRLLSELDKLRASNEYLKKWEQETASCCWENEKAASRYKQALEQIADPRLRDHKEPDAYTQLGCVMNIAHEALHPRDRSCDTMGGEV